MMAKQGKPFRVFSAFWRAACRLGAPPRPIPAPQTLSFSVLPPALGARVVALADLALEPKSPDWAGGLRATWQRGEPGAQACLERFLTGGLPGYATNRDRPDKPNTSRLSPLSSLRQHLRPPGLACRHGGDGVTRLGYRRARP